MDRDEDSLSFSSLIQPNVPSKPRVPAGRPKQLSAGPSFEFRHDITPPSSSPADLLFTNGTISPQIPFPADQKGSRSTRQRCLRQGSGRKSADSAPKRVSFQEPVPTPRRSASSPLPERSNSGSGGARPELKCKRDAEKSKGLFGSIILACRDCRAVEPSKRVGNLAN